MVSKASEDLPEPLTPVTTVMALCGTSTLIFFRLWTRAPRIEMVSWLVFTGMSSLVATGEAQTARSASAAQTSNYTASVRAGQTNYLRLFDQADLPHAAFDFKANRGGSFAVGLVSIFVVFVAQSVRFDRADAAGSADHDANFSGQPDGHLADSAFKIGNQIIFAVTRKVQVRLAGAHGHLQARHRHIAQAQLAAAGAHFDFQLERHIVAEAQVPLIVLRTEVCASIILRNTQVADAVGNVVINTRRLVRIAVVEIGIQKMAGAAADIKFTRAGFERHIDGLCALPLHCAGLVLQIAGIAAVVCEGAAVPEKNDQHQHESQGSEGRPQRDAGTWRATRILPRARDVPHLPKTNKYQDERPIGAQDRPRIESRPPVRVQEHPSDGDEHNRKHQRGSPGRSTFSH